MLAIPLADLLLAVFRRLLSGRSPFAPDKEHLHHRLLGDGNSHQRTAVIMYFWTATVAIPVTVMAFEPLWVASTVFVALALVSTSISRHWIAARRIKVDA